VEKAYVVFLCCVKHYVVSYEVTYCALCTGQSVVLVCWTVGQDCGHLVVRVSAVRYDCCRHATRPGRITSMTTDDGHHLTSQVAALTTPVQTWLSRMWF